MSLRIHTAGVLSAYELAAEMEALAGLYEFVDVLDRLEQQPSPEDARFVVPWLFSGRRLDRYEKLAVPLAGRFGIQPLECVAISHNSPGFQDLRGVPAALRGMFELLRDVIFLSRGKELHKLDVLERRERIKYVAVERLERQARVLRENGIPLEQVQQILLSACNDLAGLDGLGDARGITAIEIIDKGTVAGQVIQRELPRSEA